MRFDFSHFLLDIEHRARRFQGFSLACRLAFYGSLGSIAAILVLRWLLPNVTRGMLLLCLLIPVIFAISAFLVGWWRKPDLPRLLLTLDDELGTGARISSLYEERLREHDSFFRHRLEIMVERVAADWKRGIRVPHYTVQFLSAGLSGILLAGILLFVPLPFPQVSSMETLGQSESMSTQGLRPTSPEHERSVGSDNTAMPLEPQEQVLDSPTDASQNQLDSLSPNEELSLESVMDDLSNQSRGQAQVSVPTTSAELLDLANAQEQARQALSDMLQDLQEKMEGSPRPLTQEESAGLQELAAQTGDPSLEQAAKDLAEEIDPSGMDEKIQDLMDEMDQEANDPGAVPETNDDTEDGSGQDSPQSTEISSDEEAGRKFLEETSQRMEEQANADAQQEEQSHQAARESDPDESQEQGHDSAAEARMSGDPDDLSQVGGEDGLGGESSEGTQSREVGFVQEEGPSTIGEGGDFVDEFVTKGVPIEMIPLQNGGSKRFVDFQQMDSILKDRNLPDEAEASIRRYFELITQPEGGS